MFSFSNGDDFDMQDTEMLFLHNRIALFSFEMEGKRPSNCKKLWLSQLQVETLISCLRTSFSQLVENFGVHVLPCNVERMRGACHIYLLGVKDSFVTSDSVQPQRVHSRSFCITF